MPIHINLLAEAQAAEELRRHDPVKRAMFIGAALVALFLMWSGIVKINTILAQERYSNVESAITVQTNAYQQVELDRKKIGGIQHRLTALQKFQADRFLQGNLLDALQHATVEGVKLTRLHLDQTFILTEGTRAQTNDSRVIPGKPSTVKEKIVARLEARDFSANPGAQVSNFKEAIAHQAYFQAMLDKTNGVQLANPPSAQQVGGGKAYVMFTLDCRYPEVTR
jgi:hypothetical protein